MLQLQDELDEQQLQTSTSKIGSKSRLSYDWLSLSLIPKTDAADIKKGNETVKVEIGGLRNTERPKFVDPKIPNSSYL